MEGDERDVDDNTTEVETESTLNVERGRKAATPENVVRGADDISASLWMERTLDRKENDTRRRRGV